MIRLVVFVIVASVSIAGDSIEVDCDARQSLGDAIVRAKNLGGADIRIQGECKGNYVIDADGISLTGTTEGATLTARNPERPTIEIDDAEFTCSDVLIRGGVVGVYAHGAGADVRLLSVELSDHSEGTFADDGARMALVDSVVRNGVVGVDFRDADGSLQNVTIADHEIGVSLLSRSRVGLSGSTIRDNSGGGLVMFNRSDASIAGTSFENNGDVHISATNDCTVSLLSGTTIGSDDDPTVWAFTSTRRSSIMSFRTPQIFGNVSALDRGSISIGETELRGDIRVDLLSDAFIRDATLLGTLFCADSSTAVCRSLSVQGNSGCPAECGTAIASEPLPPPPEVPQPGTRWAPDTKR